MLVLLPFTLHNAFGNDIKKYGKDIDLLWLEHYSLFKHESARHEKKFQRSAERHGSGIKLCPTADRSMVTKYGTCNL